MSVQVHAHPGKLPPFWERRVIFFANLLSLFYGNQGETDELVDEVGGLSTYGGRLLPIIDILFGRKDNVLVLGSEPQTNLVAYFQETLGLHLPECVSLPVHLYPALYEQPGNMDKNHLQALETIREHEAEWVDGFVIDESLTRVASALGRKTVSPLEGSKRGNNKFLLHNHLEALEFPIFDTESAEHPGQVVDCLAVLEKKGYRQAVVKSQVGASGIGLKRLVIGRDSHHPIPEHMFFEGPCMVQGWLGEELEGIKSLGSPSVQMFLAEGRIHLYDLTDQVLSHESVHEGNVAPPTSLDGREELIQEVLRQASHAARWLYEQGYRGTASTDFLVVENHGAPEVRICEINARVTGATYPSVLARYFLPGGGWLMRNVRFDSPTSASDILEALERSGWLFEPGKPEGVLPINFNMSDEHEVNKGQFLFLGETLGACQVLLNQMEEILPVAWQYDRD